MRAIGLSFLFLLLSTPASADISTATISIQVQLPDGNGGFVIPTVQEQREFFGKAECFCSENGHMDSEFGVELQLMTQTPGEQLPSVNVEIWVGVDCDTDDDMMREQNCELVTTLNDINSLRTPTIERIPMDAFAFPNEMCGAREGGNGIFLLVDRNGACETSFSLQTDFDTEPPPLPQNIELGGGDSAIQINFDTPSSNIDDVFSYHALCADLDGNPLPADNFPTPDTPDYELSRTRCNMADDTTVQSDDPGTLPTGLAELQSAYLCGSAGGTETSIRISNLENEKEYRIVLVSIDNAQNASAIDLGIGTPVPSQDFWEFYENSGGEAEGVVCLFNHTGGDGGGPMLQAVRSFRDSLGASGPLGQAIVDGYYTMSPLAVALAEESVVVSWLFKILLFPIALIVAIGVWMPLPVKMLLPLSLWALKKARARHWTLRFGALASLLFVSLSISAGAETKGEPKGADEELVDPMGDKSSPYWDDFEGESPVEMEVPQSPWHLAFKVGPYIPDIDGEDGLMTINGRGPYDLMFPGTPPIWVVQVDRFFLFPLGQLGASATIGYFGNTDRAYQEDANGNLIFGPEGFPLRSETDTNAFRMVPMSLGVTYRFTALDDKWGVPLVPYGRAALSYYLWWISKAGGGLSETPTADCSAAQIAAGDCGGNRSLGGTFGYEFSLGIALRAERIDPAAAANLRTEAGIEHAGFFFEMSYAAVNGLGMANRLRVGDLTWLAGINFEF